METRCRAHLKEGLLDPDMSTQDMRLWMGEVTADQITMIRKVIAWSNETMREGARVPTGRETLTMRFGPMTAETHRAVRAVIQWNARLAESALGSENTLQTP